MAKVKMVCPISKNPCIDCAIYRGRHFYLCFSKEYHGVSLGEQQIEELKAQYTKERTKKSEENRFEIPDDVALLGTKCIKDVEDLTQAEEFKKGNK
jgi:hypothetical protein